MLRIGEDGAGVALFDDIAAARGLQHAVSPLHLRATYLRIDVAKPAGKPGHPPKPGHPQ